MNTQSILRFAASIFLGVVLCVIADAAPRPPKKKPVPPPALELAPGNWVLDWAGSEQPMDLDGANYTWVCWKGFWQWDTLTRKFSVTEWTGDGSDRKYVWYAILDKDGNGEVVGDWAGTRIKVRRAPKKVPEKLHPPKPDA